jgi:hypothetical protein
MYLLLTLATLPAPRADRAEDADPDAPALDDVLAAALQPLRQLVEDFRRQPVSPPATHAFEQQLQEPGQPPKVAIQEERVTDGHRLWLAPCSVTLYALDGR